MRRLLERLIMIDPENALVSRPGIVEQNPTHLRIEEPRPRMPQHRISRKAMRLRHSNLDAETSIFDFLHWIGNASGVFSTMSKSKSLSVNFQKYSPLMTRCFPNPLLESSVILVPRRRLQRSREARPFQSANAVELDTIRFSL